MNTKNNNNQPTNEASKQATQKGSNVYDKIQFSQSKTMDLFFISDFFSLAFRFHVAFLTLISHFSLLVAMPKTSNDCYVKTLTLKKKKKKKKGNEPHSHTHTFILKWKNTHGAHSHPPPDTYTRIHNSNTIFTKSKITKYYSIEFHRVSVVTVFHTQLTINIDKRAPPIKVIWPSTMRLSTSYLLLLSLRSLWNDEFHMWEREFKWVFECVYVQI